jgi:hypothetical protein
MRRATCIRFQDFVCISKKGDKKCQINTQNNILAMNLEKKPKKRDGSRYMNPRVLERKLATF